MISEGEGPDMIDQHENQSNTADENTGRWTKEEHTLFLEGLALHGKSWKKISHLLKTRSAIQVRTHAQKYFLKSSAQRQPEKRKDVGNDWISYGPPCNKIPRLGSDLFERNISKPQPSDFMTHSTNSFEECERSFLPLPYTFDYNYVGYQPVPATTYMTGPYHPYPINAFYMDGYYNHNLPTKYVPSAGVHFQNSFEPL